MSEAQKWIDTEARVIKSRVRDLDIQGQPLSADGRTKASYSDALIRIAWTDDSGEGHSGEFEAPEESPLFQLIEVDSKK